MQRTLISETLCQALCAQLSHERYNAGVYLYLASFLQNKGLDGLAKLFLEHWDEENSHAKQIQEFLVDMNATVHMLSVGDVNEPLDTVIDIAELYLSTEKETTESLSAIKEISIEEGNCVAEEFLRKMIDQQRNEYKEALTFYDNAELTGGDWWKCKVWSDSLSR